MPSMQRILLGCAMLATSSMGFVPMSARRWAPAPRANLAPRATTQMMAITVPASSQLAQLAAMTVLSIDTGDLDVIEEFVATGTITDATTNPLFVAQAGLSGDARYVAFVDAAIAYAQREAAADGEAAVVEVHRSRAADYLSTKWRRARLAGGRSRRLGLWRARGRDRACSGCSNHRFRAVVCVVVVWCVCVCVCVRVSSSRWTDLPSSSGSRSSSSCRDTSRPRWCNGCVRARGVRGAVAAAGQRVPGGGGGVAFVGRRSRLSGADR